MHTYILETVFENHVARHLAADRLEAQAARNSLTPQERLALDTSMDDGWSAGTPEEFAANVQRTKQDLMDRWLDILCAFVRFKRGKLRHEEFDGHMLPWQTPTLLNALASNKFYPRFQPTPDGLRIKDLWLYSYQPYLRILQDVRETLSPDGSLSTYVVKQLQDKTGLKIRFIPSR